MKNIFSNVIDKKKQTISYVGKSFVKRELSEKDAEPLDRLSKEGEKMMKKGDTSSFLWHLFAYLGFFVALFLFSMVKRSFDEEGRFTAKAIVMILFTVVGVLVFIFGLAMSKRSTVKFQVSEEATAYVKRAEEAFRFSAAKLNVPFDANKIDVFCEILSKTENGKEKSASIVRFFNEEYSLFSEGEELCFASPYVVCAIPFSCIKRMERAEKTADFTNWNKAEPPLSETYKKYRIRVGQAEIFYVKPYYRLLVEKGGEEYCVILPPYEAEKVARMAKIDFSAVQEV